MSTLTAENIFPLIEQLSGPERAKLRQFLERQETPQSANCQPPHNKRPSAKSRAQEGIKALSWIAKHRREYAGQWVALDGNRLIAASPNHDEVWTAAQADGAHLPLVTFVEDPAAPPYIGM